MPSSLDLLITPIAPEKIPGLGAALPPRRAGRGRSQDRLVMHLGVQGNAPLSENAYKKLLDSLADTYFKTPGSSTTAMRAVADSLNQSFFRRNQRIASRGIRSLGVLSLAVVRADHLYLAQCGPAQAVLVRADGIQVFTDPAAGGTGLGMGRATPIRYHQAEIAPGDLLIIGLSLPADWRQLGVRSLHGLPPEQIAPQVRKILGAGAEAALIQVVSGSGGMQLIPLTGGESVPPKASISPEISRGEQKPESESRPRVPAGVSAPKQTARPEAAAPPRKPQSPPAKKSKKPPKPPRLPVIFAALSAFLACLRRFTGRFLRGVSRVLRRILPEESDLDLPPSLMLFIAVAVPVVIVTAASVIYFREGRVRMHQEQLTHAKLAAEQALQAKDPQTARSAWEQTIAYLNAAEEFGVSDESRQLRRYAYAALDEMDKTERLDYSPILAENLPPGTAVTRMVISGENDLYLLDGESGRVLRVVWGHDGYTLDPDFVCGPIPAPSVVGPLVDIAPLPLGEEDNATIIGMDVNGVLLRCVPGEGKGSNIVIPTPPDTNWGQPTALSTDRGDTYILDPKTNAVWIYRAIDNYREVPTYYFGNYVPSLQNVADMTVSDADLYLLYEDGHMVSCSYRSYTDSPTICDDPAPFDDDRAGYADGPVMQDAHFRQIQYLPPPDPSIYLFDPDDAAIYLFSVQLKYQRQYRPSVPLPDAPTAFVIGPDRRVFVTAGDQVYEAMIP